MKTRLSRTLLIAAGVSVLLTLALAMNLLPDLRGGAGWRWPYEAPTDALRLLPGILLLAAYLALGEWWIERLETTANSRSHAFLAFCWAGGLIVQIGLLFASGSPLYLLFTRTVSSASGGFHEVGVRIADVGAFLRDYPALMPTWTAHPAAHPPGIPLLFWGTERVFAALPALADVLAGWLRPLQCHHRVLMGLPDSGIAAALVGMILPLLGALAVLPAFSFVKTLADRETALRSALWLPLIPAFLLFTPQWNQLYVLLLVIGLWLAERALSRLSLVWFFALGLLASLASFLSFTNINILGALGVFVVAYTLLAGRPNWAARDWVRLAVGLVLALTGFLTLWLAYSLASGNSPLLIFSMAFTTHMNFSKPYLPWLLYFPLDVALFSGWALFLLGLIEAWRTLREAVAIPRIAHRAAVLPVTLVVAVFGLDLTGGVRGEVGRLLLGMMPLVVFVAAQAVTERWEQALDRVSISIALALQIIVMVAFLRVIGTELSMPPAAGAADSVALAEKKPVGAVFDGRAELTGYTARVDPTAYTLDLALEWRSLGRFDHPYFLFAMVVGPDGQPLGDDNWLPIRGSYPTTCWAPGETIVDRHTLALRGVPPGDYWISLALFDFDSDERLPVVLPGAEEETQVGLGPVGVP
ncbi:MAG: hypothetical protein IT326_00300 [Anaerolineae bacterium]|nr:hypothetical protein [Anaerolineae bacterium]